MAAGPQEGGATGGRGLSPAQAHFARSASRARLAGRHVRASWGDVRASWRHVSASRGDALAERTHVLTGRRSEDGGDACRSQGERGVPLTTPMVGEGAPAWSGRRLGTLPRRQMSGATWGSAGRGTQRLWAPSGAGRGTGREVGRENGGPCAHPPWDGVPFAPEALPPQEG